jgi:hypothetical protein
MTHDGVMAKRAIGMRQTAGNGINARGVSIGVFGHPAACLAMHEAASVTDFEDLRFRGRHTIKLSAIDAELTSVKPRKTQQVEFTFLDLAGDRGVSDR